MSHKTMKVNKEKDFIKRNQTETWQLKTITTERKYSL